MYGHFACIICLCATCVPLPKETRRVPWSWSYNWLLVARWVMELNLAPLEKKSVFLTTEPLVQKWWSSVKVNSRSPPQGKNRRFYPDQVVVSLEANTDRIFTPCHGLGHIRYTKVPLEKENMSSIEKMLRGVDPSLSVILPPFWKIPYTPWII